MYTMLNTVTSVAVRAHITHIRVVLPCLRTGSMDVQNSPSFPTMSSDWINGHIKLIQGCSSLTMDIMLNTVTSVAIWAHITHTPAFLPCFRTGSMDANLHGVDPENIHQIHIRFHVPFFITKIATPAISPYIPPITYDLTRSERRSPKYIPDLGHLPS
jgi:hypothetical protein